MSKSCKAKPFIQWAGGKKSVLKYLKQNLPINYKNYYECFVGGGAMFFELQPKRSYLSDVNRRLITTYEALKENPDKVIKELENHKANNSKEYFLKCRDKFNKEIDKFKIAGLFIYINKTCFNALYRVNKKGEFNVPYGKYKNPPILDKENLLNVSRALKNVHINRHSFDKVKIEKDSFYYLDPPYYLTFSSYSGSGFDLYDHTRLRDFCNKIDKAGSFFMLSNSDNKEIRDLYKGFKIIPISATEKIACKNKSRGKGKRKEIIVKNYE